MFWKAAAAAYSCDLEYDGSRPALEGLLAVAVAWCYSLCAVTDFRLSDFFTLIVVIFSLFLCYFIILSLFSSFGLFLKF